MSDMTIDLDNPTTPLKSGDRCAVFKKDGTYLIRYFAYSSGEDHYFAVNRTDAVGHRGGNNTTKPTQKWNKWNKV